MSIFIGDASSLVHQIDTILKSQKASTDILTWLPASIIALLSAGITLWYTWLTRKLLLVSINQSNQIKNQYEMDRIPNLNADIDVVNNKFIRICNLGAYPVHVLQITESYSSPNKILLSQNPEDTKARDTSYIDILQAGSVAYLVTFTGRHSDNRIENCETKIEFISGGTAKRKFVLKVGYRKKIEPFEGIEITSMAQEEIKS